MIRVDVDSTRVDAALGRLDRDLRDIPLRDATSRIAQASTAFAPRLSGRMAAAISGRDIGGGQGEIRVEVVYGGVINYGWPKRNIAPARFIEAGIEAARRDAVDEVSTAVRELIASNRLD